jgi:hypothetical protein
MCINAGTADAWHMVRSTLLMKEKIGMETRRLGELNVSASAWDAWA